MYLRFHTQHRIKVTTVQRKIDGKKETEQKEMTWLHNKDNGQGYVPLKS